MPFTPKLTDVKYDGVTICAVGEMSFKDALRLSGDARALKPMNVGQITEWLMLEVTQRSFILWGNDEYANTPISDLPAGVALAISDVAWQVNEKGAVQLALSFLGATTKTESSSDNGASLEKDSAG